MIAQLGPGTPTEPTIGFDCNTTVSFAHAVAMRRAGHRVALRYVRRHEWHSFDVTPNEIGNLLRADLGVGVVQHVAPPGWRPSKKSGALYGRIAGEEAGGAGYELGATLWCDLEEVSSESTATEIIDFCNAWHDAASAVGYRPGLYVGWNCGLTPDELYHRLRFRAYWSAYNLARVDEPAVRGVQLRQRAARARDRVPGIPFDFDVNTVIQDALGDTPRFMFRRLIG